MDREIFCVLSCFSCALTGGCTLRGPNFLEGGVYRTFSFLHIVSKMARLIKVIVPAGFIFNLAANEVFHFQ